MTRRKLGRRRRRLRRAIGWLTVVTVVAAGVGIWVYQSTRPETRTPGEELPDITDRLARDRPTEAPLPDFVDVAGAAGLDGFRTFAGERTSQLPEDMGGGAAWGDFDGDGDDDLFLVAAGGTLTEPPERWAPSRLYENRGDGTFRAVESFPETRIVGMGAAWGDADGDGDLDLAVSGYRALLLFRNEPAGFVRDTSFETPEGYWAGLSWGDFDRDRDLDLYVSGYVRYEEPESGERRVTQQYGSAVPYTLNPASFEPEHNLLLQNRGDGTFEDVAVYYGVSNPGGRSLQALWHDLDDDGRLDLYVANDISDNALYLNRGETFEDAGLAAWVSDYRGAMGLTVGDWNRDGDEDLFITHWLGQENALYDSQLRREPPSPDGSLLELPVEPPRLTFTDLSAPLGLGPIALPLVGWGTELADFDGDGWLDLWVVNGSTLEERDPRGKQDQDNDPRNTGQRSRKLQPQKPLLLWNEKGEGFHDLWSSHSEPDSELAVPRVGRGMAVSDYDLDGDLDVVVVHLDGGAQLLRNDMQAGHWLELRLRDRRRSVDGDTEVLGDGEGATVVAWMGDVPLRRSVTGGSYLSQSTRMLHFGLGEASGIDRLEVRWPTGGVETHGPLPADSRWELREGEGEPRRLDSGGGASRVAGPADAEQPDAEQPEETEPLSRERVREFWTVQRAAMDAMKREDDPAKAAELFEKALALDPSHQDSRYYLATCLWSLGERDRALEELGELRRRNPRSHRAQRQWAVLRALSARGPEDLEAAEAAAQEALEINREETGALLLLGELSLLQGEPDVARERLELACRSNPRAVGGFYLRAFLAWRAGDREQAEELLRQAREALGPEWKPEGAVAEGDTEARMHQEETPLSPYWQGWDGEPDPAAAFGDLAERLEG